MINSSVELAIILSGLVATGEAVALGHWLGKWMGAGLLGALALMAAALCDLGYRMLGWPGLVAASLVVAAAGDLPSSTAYTCLASSCQVLLESVA